MKSLASSSTKSIDLFDRTRWTSETSPEHREPEVAFVHDLPVQHLLRRCRDVGHGMRLPPYKMHESTHDSVSQADPASMTRLRNGLDEFLERDQDRALFDLPPHGRKTPNSLSMGFLGDFGMS